MSFLDHTSENSSEGASPQQMEPCDHLAGLEEGSFQKWEEPCPAQQGVRTVALPACCMKKPCLSGL